LRVIAPSNPGAAAAPVDSLAIPDPHSADLVVRALGGTDVWARGTKIETWATQRGLMVLRYLVLHRERPVQRETLMDLLWPHSSVNAARNNLNVAIYGLRRSLEEGGEGPYVIHRNGSYSLAPALSLATDVHAFERAIVDAQEADRRNDHRRAERSYHKALGLYGGPLFSDDAEGDWYLIDRRILEERHLNAAEWIANEAFRRSSLSECIDSCHNILRTDPCRETAHQLLMRAYAAAGQIHLAVRQYTACVAVLQSELGVGPHPNTTLVLEGLLGGR
jgi:DNA-binding SARP family transcriptional activator